jgi:diacylglycerol kinase (ATP)
VSSPPRVIAVVVNPAAGGAAGVAPVVVDELRAAGAAVVVVAAGDEGALRRRIGEVLGLGVDALVVVGGDGLVNLAVGCLTGRDVPLGIVPAGSGNDAARELGIVMTDPAAATRSILEAMDEPPRMLDVGVVESLVPGGGSRRFLCAVSAGFDALVNERANRLRFPRGPRRYSVALVLELLRLRERRYTVTIDDEIVVFESVLLAVANLGSIGGGMRIVPFASAEDGRLDVFSVAAVSRARFLRLFPRVFAGRHTGLDVVAFHRASVVRIACDEPIVAYADGERIGPLPLRISVEEGALAVLA